ncbi:hypothetical protein BaRGS_00022320 [Batillaria attramentaria]|uniref:Uncharacterized protein n=1 Tax=Batillaria attramentaria TaxID=370345 RepID=A0ABD0KHJ6_9CAEN
MTAEVHTLQQEETTPCDEQLPLPHLAVGLVPHVVFVQVQLTVMIPASEGPRLPETQEVLPRVQVSLSEARSPV